jgi:Zn-dependent M28 family amino/carboxypeptidase
VNRFDTARAFTLIRRQVAVGQRPAGSPQLRALAEQLRPMLPGGRFEDVPNHPGLRNIVGVLPGRKPAIVLGAHYDSEFHPPGFVGANDSAAGTAAVIELARALRAEHRPRTAREIQFVLFDGEEEPPHSTDFKRDALRGSKAYVRAHRAQIREMVLLDYIANKGLRLPRERTSNRALWARMRAAAARVGVGAVFPARTETTILDDHTPFLDAGIPAIDLIDFSYRYADTVRDTVDKLSERSLDAVGESTLQLMRELRAR